MVQEMDVAHAVETCSITGAIDLFEICFINLGPSYVFVTGEEIFQRLGAIHVVEISFKYLEGRT